MVGYFCLSIVATRCPSERHSQKTVVTGDSARMQLPKPPTTFLTCFCRGERRKYAGKKSCLHWGLNSQPPGHESDTITTEPPGRGI